MLPPDSVLKAAQRWLRLLQRSSLHQASALLRADPAFTDLSTTQYATALDWLKQAGLVQASALLAPEARRLTETQLSQALFSRALEALAPPWLPDADTLVPDASELPADAAGLAAALGVSDTAALLCVRQVHGRIDLAERARVGLAGEQGLVAVLERQWPGSTAHLALHDDGLGYDIAFTPAVRTWHLEVKTTSRRGRLVLYLSRHEHETALLDPDWRLVVVGLGEDNQPAALATARHEALHARAPRDHDPRARWEAARHQLTPADLLPALPFAGQPPSAAPDPLLRTGTTSRTFAWMPAGVA